MTNPIGSGQDLAHQPAVAVARQADAAEAATRKAQRNHDQAGRLAVELIQNAAKVSAPTPEPPKEERGSLVDKTA